MSIKKINADQGEEESFTRRNFFILAGWGALFASFMGAVGAVGRFLIPNALYEPPSIVTLGKISDFPEGSVKFHERERMFVVRKDNRIRVASGVCTHLGCTIYWSDTTRQFECPCHGSFFSPDGEVLSGPAPRPMVWLHVKYSPDRHLLVNKKRAVIKDFFLKV